MEYRYVDWNFTFENGVMVDAFYIGVPGSKEFNIGSGYVFKRGSLPLRPLVCLVAGEEGSQRGVKLALLAALEWYIVGYQRKGTPPLDALKANLDGFKKPCSIGKRYRTPHPLINYAGWPKAKSCLFLFPFRLLSRVRHFEISHSECISKKRWLTSPLLH